MKSSNDAPSDRVDDPQTVGFVAPGSGKKQSRKTEGKFEIEWGIGQILKEIRESRGIKLKELASALRSDVGNLSRLERGAQKGDFAKWHAICEALGTELPLVWRQYMERKTAGFADMSILSEGAEALKSFEVQAKKHDQALLEVAEASNDAIAALQEIKHFAEIAEAEAKGLPPPTKKVQQGKIDPPTAEQEDELKRLFRMLVPERRWLMLLTLRNELKQQAIETAKANKKLHDELLKDPRVMKLLHDLETIKQANK